MGTTEDTEDTELVINPFSGSVHVQVRLSVAATPYSLGKLASLPSSVFSVASMVKCQISFAPAASWPFSLPPLSYGMELRKCR
jgi:hypothetical protein